MKRWGPLLLVAAVLIALPFLRSRPVEISLEIDFGERAREVRKAKLVFTGADDHIERALDLRLPEGAAGRELRRVRLRQGEYSVGCAIRYADGGEKNLTRPLRVEREGTYSLEL